MKLHDSKKDIYQTVVHWIPEVLQRPPGGVKGSEDRRREQHSWEEATPTSTRATPHAHSLHIGLHLKFHFEKGIQLLEIENY